MPWSLLLTALVLVIASGVLVMIERKRSSKDLARTAIIETSVVSAARMIQRQHQRKFGRASTDLAEIESGLPSMANGSRGK